MKRKLIVAVLLAGLTAAAAWWVWPSSKTADPAGLKLFGNVDIREVNLGFRVPGKLLEVLRDEGDAVRPGDKLARLDEEPIRREVPILSPKFLPPVSFNLRQRAGKTRRLTPSSPSGRMRP
jgi:HlyD family secretion protein